MAGLLRRASPVVIATLLLMVSFGMLVTLSMNRKLVAAPSPCRVILSLDVSGSIGDNWPRFAGQVQSIFDPAFGPRQPDGTPRSDIQVAFWTFSNSNRADFNQYYYNYVYTNLPAGNPDREGFISALNRVLPDSGLTNYAQGFGYNPTRSGSTNTTFNLTLGTSISGIADPLNGINPDLIILLTDGEPNSPGWIDPTNPTGAAYNTDGNDAAINAAIAARRLYSNTKFAGGFINPNTDRALWNLAQVINENSNTNAPNIGPLSIDGTLNKFITDNIALSCNARPQSSTYAMEPVVTVTSRNPVIAGSGEQAQFEQKVNVTSNNPTAIYSSKWQNYTVVIPPSVSVGEGPIAGCNGKTYCDNVAGCDQIWGLFTGAGVANARTVVKCIPNGNAEDRSFSQNGTNDLGYYLVAVDATMAEGTKICLMLRLEDPTSGSEVNRMSSAACKVVGKLPLVQIWGGDLRVRGSGQGAYTSTFNWGGNTTFGSWVEYGMLAPGVIKSVASLAGYGKEGSTRGTHCDSGRSSPLAFSNTPDCGSYPFDIGLMPDIESVLKNAGNLSSLPCPAAGPLIVAKGKQYILYAPTATVTIGCNIKYDEGAFNVSEIESSQLPQLVIIANQINIAPNVGRVDAWLIAKNGSVNTCYSFDIVNCSSQLIINGPVMADKLFLWRTIVSRTTNPTDLATPAEIINLPGSSLIWAYNYNNSNSSQRLITTSTVELPPYY